MKQLLHLTVLLVTKSLKKNVVYQPTTHLPGKWVAAMLNCMLILVKVVMLEFIMKIRKLLDHTMVVTQKSLFCKDLLYYVYTYLDRSGVYDPLCVSE